MNSGTPDEELYALFLRERSEEALLHLITRHKESLMLFLNGFVHDLTMAEELALDAFAEVAAGPTLFRGRSSFRTWLFSIGRNLALKALKRSGLADESSEDARTESPEMEILLDERNRQLYEGLSKIKDDYRRVLILLYFEGMTHEEVSAVMKKSRKQIYNLADRGKSALREELLKMGFTCEIG